MALPEPDEPASEITEIVELEVLEGLVPFVLDEVAALATTTGPPIEVVDHDDTAVRVRSPRSSRSALVGLRTSVAAHVVLSFEVSRPRTLLSPEHLRRIADLVGSIQRANPKGSFSGVRISAAGSDSVDLRRFADEVARAAGLVSDPDDGDLLVRVRRSRVIGRGWDVLVRLTPRPSATRRWRVADYPGAVNATIAAAMVATTRPTRDDRYLNLMCGSGTLLVERLALGAPLEMVGVDHSPMAVEATNANLRAARYKGRVDLWEADATALGDVHRPRFDVLVADLPWGTLLGSHADNATLYPSVLAEAARVAVSGARFVVLTHEVRLIGRVLDRQSAWRPITEIRVFQKGHHPRLILLERAAS